MSDIFLSYAREDEERVRPIVEQLKAQGWSVFWDGDIPPGKSFRQHIKEQLDDARCVVVVWSKHSVNSHWVQEEAEAGRKQTILVPLRIDRIDPPFGFGSIQAADLTAWNNDAGNAEFRKCIGAIESIVSPSREAAPVNELSISRKPKRLKLPKIPTLPKIPVIDILHSVPAWGVVFVAMAVFIFLMVFNQRNSPDIVRPPETQITERNAGLPENFVLITGRPFTMGSPKGEVDRGPDETQHEVKLSDFAICKYEVTVGEYLEFVREKKSHYPKWMEPGGSEENIRIVSGSYYSDLREALTGMNYPIVGVSWDDANAYCDWLSKKRGGTYRLPTEAEWEYACRAGTTTPFNTGENLTTDQANYDGNYPYRNNPKGEYRQKTVPVDSLKTNGFGLYNMHGNVWEWCSDWYDSDYYEKCRQQGVVENPQGPKTGSNRVLRGGGWPDYARFCRSADRGDVGPGSRGSDVGFRLVFVPQFTSSQKPEEK